MNSTCWYKYVAVSLLLLPWCGINAYTGSRFIDVHKAVFGEPYVELPTYDVKSHLFGPSGNTDNNLLLEDARRTMTSDEDLLDFQAGQKLLQPNGICFSGYWVIDDTDYTGVLARGTRALVIVRASVSLGGTRYRNKRAFSMAIKVFPTLDQTKQVHTRNLLVMESISGVSRKYFHDAVMDNDPPLGGIPSLGSLGTSLRIYNDMKRADAELSPAGPQLTYRPVTDLAADPDTEIIVSPRWLRLRLDDNIMLVTEDDFRDELSLSHYPGNAMTRIIEAADPNDAGKRQAAWQPIGKLELEQSTRSAGCDKRLHFTHPVVKQP